MRACCLLRLLGLNPSGPQWHTCHIIHSVNDGGNQTNVIRPADEKFIFKIFIFGGELKKAFINNINSIVRFCHYFLRAYYCTCTLRFDGKLYEFLKWHSKIIDRWYLQVYDTDINIILYIIIIVVYEQWNAVDPHTNNTKRVFFVRRSRRRRARRRQSSFQYLLLLIYYYYS